MLNLLLMVLLLLHLLTNITINTNDTIIIIVVFFVRVFIPSSFPFINLLMLLVRLLLLLLLPPATMLLLSFAIPSIGTVYWTAATTTTDPVHSGTKIQVTHAIDDSSTCTLAGYFLFGCSGGSTIYTINAIIVVFVFVIVSCGRRSTEWRSIRCTPTIIIRALMLCVMLLVYHSRSAIFIVDPQRRFYRYGCALGIVILLLLLPI